MRFIPSLFFAVVLTMGYFLFFRAQAESGSRPPAAAPKSVVVQSHEAGLYKADMDRAHLAADQMISARAEADGIP